MVRDLNEFGIVVVNCSDKAESADHLTLGICLDLRGAPADGNCMKLLYIYIYICTVGIIGYTCFVGFSTVKNT